MLSQSYDKILGDGKKLAVEEVKVSIGSPKKGINSERLFTALNLLLSEEDVLDYLDNHQEVRSPTPIEDEVSTKTA